jgi:hypothetical protein
MYSDAPSIALANVVKSHSDGVLLGVGVDSPCLTDGGRGCDAADAEGLGHFEATLHLCIVHVGGEFVIVGVEQNTSSVKLLPNLTKVGQWNIEAPFPQVLPLQVHGLNGRRVQQVP